jgi:hypothetical protein
MIVMSKVMMPRMLPLNVWLPIDGANRWGIPAARIMGAMNIGLKSGSLKACRKRGGRHSYGSPNATF